MSDVTITAKRGNDVIQPFVYTPTTDITGYTLLFTVAKARNSATKLVQVTCVTLAAASGTFKATIPAATLAAIEPGTYYWDVTRTDSGSVATVRSGRFILQGVARLPT